MNKIPEKIALPGIPDLVCIATERLLLRELSPRVYRYVFDTYSDVTLKHFFGYADDEELEKEKARYNGGMESFNRSFFIFQILLRDNLKAIGNIGYHTWYTLHDRAEIFYDIRHISERRKGYASEAIQPVIAYGFGPMKLNRIEAFLATDNTASLKLLSRSGFTREGTLKKHYLVQGVYEDSDVYGLLKETYSV